MNSPGPIIKDRKHLYKQNIYNREANPKSFVIAVNAKRHLMLCQNYKIWSIDKYKTVILSEKSSFTLLPITVGGHIQKHLIVILFFHLNVVGKSDMIYAAVSWLFAGSIVILKRIITGLKNWAVLSDQINLVMQTLSDVIMLLFI